MKTLIMIALISLTTISGYAQNKKNCVCKTTTIHHKVAAMHHKVLPQRETQRSLPPYITVLAHTPNLNTTPPPPPEPCYTYRQHNIVVEECPSTIYDSNGAIQYARDGVYMGYYPEANDEGVNPLIAPQHTVISNYKGTAPADGNACNDCSPR